MAVLLGALVMFSSWGLPAMAQTRLTSDQLDELAAKVQTQRNAYWRFQEAEQEAQADQSPERAALYHEAKIKAYEAYMDLSAQLEKAKLEYREQHKQQDSLEITR
jgi:hypothetical protein